MILLDYQDRRPLYEQVREKLRILIYQEVMPAGTRLPSVRQLAMELSINPNTIQRAYMELEQEGLIYPVKGKGNFVADISVIQEKTRAAYCKKLREIVEKGKKLGIAENEIIHLIKIYYEEGVYDQD